VPSYLRCILLFLFCAVNAPGLQAADIDLVKIKPSSSRQLSDLPWEFYWQRYLYPVDFVAGAKPPAPDLLLPGPRIWNGLIVQGKSLGSFGYATYRVRFSIAANGKRLALRIPAPLASYRIFINGQRLAEEGTLVKTADTFEGRRKSVLLSFFSPTGKIEIVIHVANYLLYKGGLRSDIEIGTDSAMRLFGMRYLAVDLFCLGLIFSIMLYHLLLYFLARRNKAVIIFAVMAIDYFFLATLFGEQSILLFFPSLPLEVHTRLSSAFAYVLPVLVVQFIDTLFPNIIAKKIRQLFWAAAGVFVILLILPVHYFSFYNVFYYGIVGVGAELVSLAAIYRAVREGRAGARLLGIGIIVLLMLTIYAVFLFATHSQAGSFLSIGFSLFALTQSGSLAHAHAGLSEENERMQSRLETSRVALDEQRKRIEANLHDSLGGNLTDIKLALEAMADDASARALRKDIRRLDKRVAATIASLRTELLFLEDMQLATEDFISGINLILLRRYQMAKRPVDIRISAETRSASRQLRESGVLPVENIPELCMIVQELCNNSLKYSVGVTVWEIIVAMGTLRIVVFGKSRYRRARAGLGQGTLKQRIERIGAHCIQDLAGRDFTAKISIGEMHAGISGVV